MVNTCRKAGRMLNRSKGWGKYPFVDLISLLILLCTLVACGYSGQTSTSSNSALVGTAGTTSKATATAAIKQGAQACPETVSTTQYWDALVPTQPPNNIVESVTCASLMGTSSLQALVTVRSAGSGRALDVHIYNNITAPQPDEIFQLQNLLNGDAKVSGYNTVITGEVDPNSQINKYQKNADATVDLFREFKWFDSTHTFYPVAFPGLFPDLTRYEAESDQQKVDQGQQAWQLDAAQVANRFANIYLKWPLSSNTTVDSGGQNGDKDATVTVKDSEAGNPNIKVSMSRLENNTTNGIWIVKNVTSDGLSISNPTNLDIIGSPTTITGDVSGGASGQIFVLDHLGEKIGAVQVTGNTNFSTAISFQPTFTNGDEEGMLAFYTYSTVYGTISGVAMVKVLLH
jgi:hypothetical protein